ncbi:MULTISPECIES: AAA family ATPase [unclassified Thalassospira]|uniref:AAA family ATPase n=1 Tax=Thalassospira sp. TaxID=1912094 RepID=UPI001B152707|nr:AAA family ATPase [Thalassospira sp.]
MFGFNGTGKTTLSRILSSLEKGTIDPKLPNSCSFKIQLSENTTIIQTLDQPPFGSNLLVFNTDFVERNFNWDDSSSQGILYVSEKKVGAKKAYDESSTKLKATTKEISELESRQKSSEKQLKEFKTRVAKQIREMTPESVYTQAYDARKIQAHYKGSKFEESLLASEKQIARNQETLMRKLPPDKISFSFTLPEDLQSWLSSGQKLIMRSSAEMAVEALEEHQEAIAWIKRGLEYHDQHELNQCLLCENPFTEERRNFLKSIFNDAWDDAANELKSAIQLGEKHLDNLRSFYSNLPPPELIESNFKEEYTAAFKSLRKHTSKIGEAGKFIIFKLKEKLDPSLNSLGSPLPTLESDINDIVKDFLSEASKAEKLVGAHNEQAITFGNEQKLAFESLERHVLASNQATWDSLQEDLNKYEMKLVSSRDELRSLKVKTDELQNELQDHGIGAERLNALLFSYLGHKNIYLTAQETGGYKIIRIDGQAALHLSEGEKTAIAFSYFLTKLEADDRKLKDLVLVIDDPVSSLDASARTHAFSLLFRKTKKCQQLIVLTHNTAFMNMVKREFQNLEHRNAAEIALLSLDCRSPADGSERRTNLAKMHPLMANHQSEYHYLFQLVRTAAAKAETDYLYLLPNATRKLLDIFTTFCSPGQPNFTAALMEHHETVKDQIDIKALERLIQVESHGTIEGFGTLPDLTLQDAISAAKAAIGFIENVSKDHYKRMCKACGTIG